MKNLLTILLFLCCFTSVGQNVVQRSSSNVTVQDSRLFAQYNFRVPPFLDTTTANLPSYRGLDSCGKIIYTYKTNSFWYRGCFPKRWLQFPSSGNGSTVSVLNDSSILICNNSVCDTVIVRKQTVSTVTIINDSTLWVCNGNNVCDTIQINPTNFSNETLQQVTTNGSYTNVYSYMDGGLYVGGGPSGGLYLAGYTKLVGNSGTPFKTNTFPNATGTVALRAEDSTGSPINMVYQDVAGLFHKAAVPTSSTTTASNGLTKTVNDIALGGTGTGNTNINWGAFTFTHTFNSMTGNGFNVTSSTTSSADHNLLNVSLNGSISGSSFQTTSTVSGNNSQTSSNGVNYGGLFQASNGGNSNTGVKGIGTQNGVWGSGDRAVYGSGTSYGVYGDGNSSGTAIYGQTVSGVPLDIRLNKNTGTTVEPVIQIYRQNTGAGTTSGIGAKIQYLISTSSFGMLTSNELISKWTNVGDAARVSQFVITGVNTGTTADLFTLSGNGGLKLNKYGVGTFTGTPAYDIAVDASGNLIEIGQTKAGSFSQVGTATTTFTVTFGGTQPNSTYKVLVTPTAALSAALFYVSNKTTTTFDVVYLAGLSGSVTFDWLLSQ